MFNRLCTVDWTLLIAAFYGEAPLYRSDFSIKSFNYSAREKEQYPNYWMVIYKQFFCYHRKWILRHYKQTSWAFSKYTWSSQFWVLDLSCKEQKKKVDEREELWSRIIKNIPRPYLNFLMNIRLDCLASTKGTFSMWIPNLALFLQ